MAMFQKTRRKFIFSTDKSLLCIRKMYKDDRLSNHDFSYLAAQCFPKCAALLG